MVLWDFQTIFGNSRTIFVEFDMGFHTWFWSDFRSSNCNLQKSVGSVVAAKKKRFQTKKSGTQNSVGKEFSEIRLFSLSSQNIILIAVDILFFFLFTSFYWIYPLIASQFGSSLKSILGYAHVDWILTHYDEFHSLLSSAIFRTLLFFSYFSSSNRIHILNVSLSLTQSQPFTKNFISCQRHLKSLHLLWSELE